jgi:Outer membrane protein beta-barrel domain
MLSRRMLLALGVVLAAATPSAYAQYYGSNYENPVQWYVDGGLNVPAGNTANLLNTGWNFGFGVIFRQPQAPFGLRLDFNWSTNNASAHALYEASGATKMNIDGGWADVWSLSAGGEYRFNFNPQTYGYITAGIGAYYTSVQLTEVGYGYVCNPWWGYCYVGTGQAVVASNASTHFGWDAGLGVAFKLASGATLFAEAKYTWIDTSSQTITYIPVLFGVRF